MVLVVAKEPRTSPIDFSSSIFQADESLYGRFSIEEERLIVEKLIEWLITYIGFLFVKHHLGLVRVKLCSWEKWNIAGVDESLPLC